MEEPEAGGTKWLPVEAYDILTDTVEEFQPCVATDQVAAYVEPRREVIIVGTVPSIKGLQRFSFKVDSGKIVPYRIISGMASIPLSDVNIDKGGNSVVACGQRVYLLSSGAPNKGSFFMLTLGHGYQAAWSRLTNANISRRGSAINACEYWPCSSL